MSKTLRILLAAVLLAALLGIQPLSTTAAPIPITPQGYTPPPIKIAVVHSQTTLDWLNYRGTPTRYPHANKEAAVLGYLRARGYDVTEIVGDRDLLNSDSLKQYDVIILPSMYAMGKKASESVARYVAGGGGLVATMSSPRIDPAHAPRHGQKENMNEWWWRVMASNAWEWGPVSSVFQAKFVNDGAYTPEFTLKPNPNSSIVASASAILQARGYDGSLAGLTVHHPACSIEMALPIAGDPDRQSAADFNILTSSVKAKYRGTYTAVLASRYGSGRSVKFFFSVIDFLQNYNTKLYSPASPKGFPQGEAAGAYLESSIIWAATHDGTTVRSIDATSYASVSARGGKVTAHQTVRSTGNAITQGTVRFAIYKPSGRLLKSWSKKNVLMLPHQKRTYSYKYGHKLGNGAFKVVAAFDYGYPLGTRRASTQATLLRGGTAATR